jgi:hypothetical protein
MKPITIILFHDRSHQQQQHNKPCNKDMHSPQVQDLLSANIATAMMTGSGVGLPHGLFGEE